MKITISTFLCLAIVSLNVPADAQAAGELTDPVEILKKVDAATKAVTAVKYDVTVEATGAMAERSARLTASVVMSGFANGAPQKYFIDATVKLPNSEETRRVSGGTDSDMFFIVDHQAKIVYEDMDPAVMGFAGGVLRQAMMVEFVHDQPFSDEINGKTHELKDSERVGDEECYVIYVAYAGSTAREATWSFSKKDFLPRRRVDKFSRDGETSTRIKTITNLKVRPKLDDSLFKVKLPDGYKKTDDFAPNFLTPPGPR